MNTRYLSFVFSLSIFFSFCEELREAKGFCRDEGFDSSILKFNQKESLMINYVCNCLSNRGNCPFTNTHQNMGKIRLQSTMDNQ